MASNRSLMAASPHRRMRQGAQLTGISVIIELNVWSCGAFGYQLEDTVYLSTRELAALTRPKLDPNRRRSALNIAQSTDPCARSATASCV
jgi:hypothetical protein